VSLNSTIDIGDYTKARLFYPDGKREEYDSQTLACALYFGLPKGERAAFRGKNDTTPVYPWDLVDR
jgi:hypothetical protein